MSSRVDIFRLAAAHSYTIEKGEKRTDTHNYVHNSAGDGSGRTYFIPQTYPCIIPQHPPPRLDTWDCLSAYTPPPEVESPRKWMMYSLGDDYLPLTLGGPIDAEEREDIESAILNSSIQRAIAGASRSDIVPRYTGVSMMAIVGLIVIVTLVIMMIGIQQYVFTGGEDAPPPAQSEFSEELQSDMIGVPDAFN